MLRRPTRRYNKTPSRRKMGTGVGGQSKLTRRTPISVTDTTFGAGPPKTAIVTFDQPVILKGVPQWPNQASELPTSATIDETRTIVTLSGYTTTATSVDAPFEDPGIRNGAGGYVSPGTFSGA